MTYEGEYIFLLSGFKGVLHRFQGNFGDDVPVIRYIRDRDNVIHKILWVFTAFILIMKQLTLKKKFVAIFFWIDTTSHEEMTNFFLHFFLLYI